MSFTENLAGKSSFDYTVCFSIADFKLTTYLESFPSGQQWPPLLSSFTASTREAGAAGLNFKWIEDSDFRPEKISGGQYSTLRRKWLAGYLDDKEQVFSHILNDTWTVFFASARGNALGVGPGECFFDIFSSALNLAYLKLSLTENFFLLHAAAIIVSGRCLLFLAASGGGKTTVSENAISRGYEILSDDHVFVVPDKDRYYAHGTPFGKIGLNRRGYPIAGVFVLEQADDDCIEPAANIDIFKELWFFEYVRRRRNFGGLAASNFFFRFMDFLNDHPTFRLKFKKDFHDWDYLARFIEEFCISEKAGNDR